MGGARSDSHRKRSTSWGKSWQIAKAKQEKGKKACWILLQAAAFQRFGSAPTSSSKFGFPLAEQVLSQLSYTPAPTQ
jgi:hypothetical protein